MSEITPESWLVSGGRSRIPGQPLNPPPVLASNFYLPAERVYSRGEGTETVDALETLIGGLEGGQALAFSSGMASVAAVFNRLPVGSILAIPTDPYHAVAGLAREGEEQGRWTVIRIETADTDAWIEAVGVADLVWPRITRQPVDRRRRPSRHLRGPPQAGDSGGCRLDLRHPAAAAAAGIGSRHRYARRHQVSSAATRICWQASWSRGTTVSMTSCIIDGVSAEGQSGPWRHIWRLGVPARWRFVWSGAQVNAMELAHRLESHSQIMRVRYPGLESHGTFTTTPRNSWTDMGR